MLSTKSARSNANAFSKIEMKTVNINVFVSALRNLALVKTVSYTPLDVYKRQHCIHPFVFDFVWNS